MNRLSKIISIAAFSMMVLLLPAIASAQYYPNGNQYPNDPYGRNGGYNNGQYGNYGNIKTTLRNLKERSKNFKRSVERSNDRDNGGWWGGNGNNNNNRTLRSLADDFKKATDRLEKKYGNGRDLYRSSDEARRVLDIGSQIDREFSRMRFNNNLRNEWNQINYDLRIVAGTYGYNNNRYPQNRSGRSNRPSWWPF